jgi:hypothetical protein
VITQPAIMGLRDWADCIVLDLSTYGPISRLDDEDKWQDWGLQFCAISGLSQKNIPTPFAFTDWREWAQRFVGVMD